MKTKINLEENITWNFIKRTMYALQVIIIAMAIPVLSYLELSHVEKPEISSAKNSSVSIANPNVFTLK